jgi:hypothetical protein
VVIAEPELAAHRFKICLLHCLAHSFLVRKIAFRRNDS